MIFISEDDNLFSFLSLSASFSFSSIHAEYALTNLFKLSQSSSWVEFANIFASKIKSMSSKLNFGKLIGYNGTNSLRMLYLKNFS